MNGKKAMNRAPEVLYDPLVDKVRRALRDVGALLASVSPVAVGYIFGVFYGLAAMAIVLGITIVVLNRQFDIQTISLTYRGTRPVHYKGTVIDLFGLTAQEIYIRDQANPSVFRVALCFGSFNDIPEDAREVRLTFFDENRQQRAQFRQAQSCTRLTFFDKAGFERARLDIPESGSSEREANPRLSLYDQDGNERAALGSSSLTFYDENGKPLWSAPGEPLPTA